MRSLCCSSPLEWEVFSCHSVMSSGLSKCGRNWGSPALPRSLLWLCQCHLAGDNEDLRYGWDRDSSSLYCPSLIHFFCKSQTLPCLSRANSSFLPFCFIILDGCFQSGLLPHFPAGIPGSSNPHASLNSHAFGQLQSCSQFVPLSWFPSKFGHFGGARMDSIDFGF